METPRPFATSTPRKMPRISGRPSVHDTNSVHSPIESNELRQFRMPEAMINKSPSPRAKSPHQSPDQSISHSESEEFSSEGEDREEVLVTNRHELSNESGIGNNSNRSNPSMSPRVANKNPQNQSILNVAVLLFILVPIAGSLLAIYRAQEPVNTTSPERLLKTFQSLQKQFDTQPKDFWRSVRLNIEEIHNHHKPSSIIFLYENRGKSTMNSILHEVSHTALCHLTSCDKDPVEIQGSSLNSSDIINDYGKVITWYRAPLEASGVMIVNNLEQVPGKVAQAFHHFCDEYDPLVQNALLLFTVKVDKLPGSVQPDKYLRNALSQAWNDIGKDDKFEPLFARISGTVLVVYPE